MSGSSSAAIPQAVGAVTQAFDSAVAAINQVLQNFSSSGSVSGSGSGTASGSGSGSSLVTTIDSALNGLASQIGSALANVPNGAQVSTFIQAQVADAEFILDALANDLEATAGTAGQNVSALDVVLANDVLDLAELNAQYDIESLGGGTNGSNGA